VCLGHQSIGQAFGARIVRGEPVHGKTAKILHDGAGVYAGLDQGFEATRYHSLVIEPDSLPDCLVVTSRTPDGTIMGVRHRDFPGGGRAVPPRERPDPPGARPAQELPGRLAVLRETLRKAAEGRTLSEGEAERALEAIMEGTVAPAATAALLTALRVKGEAVPEIVGFARAMRRFAASVDAPPDVVDTCGTGGDAKGTINVSTAAAFVARGAGVVIAKHGNRAATSRAGSADVLEALGAEIELSPEQVSRCIEEAGIGFMFARTHHPAMRFVAPVRAELPFRTIFNLLGPLTNPAGSRRQLVGVFGAAFVRPVAEALRDLGAERALVVHGTDGMDEITTSAETVVAEVSTGT
jgi:anthranilate phosphoribosyltransferase